MGTADMLQLATSRTMVPKDETKEKEKKDQRRSVKRAKREIMAMVIEGMKGEGEKAKPKGSKAEQASNTLLALVRGEKKRGTASMLGVDLKKNATEYVPSRKMPDGETVLMIPRP